MSSRPESSPMRFANDWPGLFLRGDHALYYAYCLSLVLSEPENLASNEGAMETLRSLARLLASCRGNNPEGCQELASWEECQPDVVAAHREVVRRAEMVVDEPSPQLVAWLGEALECSRATAKDGGEP